MRTSLIIGLLVAVMAIACADGSETGDQLTIVATTTILGDVTAKVAGPYASVEVLIPLGADPHDYQASSQQTASINRADLVVANGLHLEEGLEDVLESALSDGANILEVGGSVHPIPFGGQDEGGDDPHFWMDPIRVAAAARLIAAELAKIDGSVDWAEQADTYVDELESLDDEIISILEPVGDGARKLVTNHDSMGYFAHRYDFEIIGVVIPGGSTLGDPSSEELAELVRVIDREQVPAIFAETTEPSALSDAVAAEAGEDVEVVELYSGSLGPPGSGAESVLGMLRTNAERIADALT